MAKQSSTVLVAIAVVFLVHFAAIPSVDGSRRINSPPEPSSSSLSACGNGDGGSCSVSCEKPSKDCDFYFEGHEDEVPKIKLIEKGDNNIYVHCGHIVHKTESQVLKVQTVNSAHCEVLKGGSWNKHACHHRLYGNGRHIASREFNIGNPGVFLNTCIKVQISAAQYEGGANFNNGHDNPRSCILVKTEGSFEICNGTNCNSPPSPAPPSCSGTDCNPPPPCHGTDCKPPSPPPCSGNDCEPPSPPSCTGSDCKPPSPQPCDGSDCEPPSPPPPSCSGNDCKPPSPPPCEGTDCKPPTPPSSSSPPPCEGTDCKPPTPPSPPSCTGSDCTPPPPPCDDGDDCQPPSNPSKPSTPSPQPDCGNGGGNCAVSCDKPLKDCDFYFHGHEDDVPKVTLIKKGDNNIYVDCGHILHRDGYDTRPVQTVNSAHCELLKGGSWNKHACHHRVYGNGRYIVSREFNVGKPTDFLNACIKMQISAAEYMDGGNFNNGHSNPRACILVKTEGSFK